MDQLSVLNASAARLRGIVESLDADQLRAPSYATEWSIDGVLSHLGSGADINRARLEAAVEGRDLADDFAQPIWDEWNAKSPEERAADALDADRKLLDRVGAIADADRDGLLISMGPLELTLTALLGLRLNEHALHTWDIAAMFTPEATLPVDAASLCVDNLAMIVQFTGKPTGTRHQLNVRTTEPRRDFVLDLGDDAVSLAPSDRGSEPDVELPAEAFVRLVYGRMDPEHTPPVSGRADLDELRRAFPGV
jgi:uncharacterized protein (TIGR03083 family)